MYEIFFFLDHLLTHLSFSQCSKILVRNQLLISAYPLGRDVNTGAARFSVQKVVLTLSTQEKNVSIKYDSVEVPPVVWTITSFSFFFFKHSMLHSSSVVEWWKSRYAVIHTSTLEPSLHYIKTLNQRDKQENLANILKATRRQNNFKSYLYINVYINQVSPPLFELIPKHTLLWMTTGARHYPYRGIISEKPLPLQVWTDLNRET